LIEADDDPLVAIRIAYYARVREILNWILTNLNIFSNNNLLKHALECAPFTKHRSRHLLFRNDYRAALQLFAAFEFITKPEFKKVLKHFLTSAAYRALNTERWFVVKIDPRGRNVDQLREVSTYCGWRTYYKNESGDFSCSKGEYETYDEWYPDGGRIVKLNSNERVYEVLACNVKNPLFEDIEIPKSVQMHVNGPSVELCDTLHLMGNKGATYDHVEDLSELSSVWLFVFYDLLFNYCRASHTLIF